VRIVLKTDEFDLISDDASVMMFVNNSSNSVNWNTLFPFV